MTIHLPKPVRHNRFNTCEPRAPAPIRVCKQVSSIAPLHCAAKEWLKSSMHDNSWIGRSRIYFLIAGVIGLTMYPELPLVHNPDITARSLSVSTVLTKKVSTFSAIDAFERFRGISHRNRIVTSEYESPSEAISWLQRMFDSKENRVQPLLYLRLLSRFNKEEKSQLISPWTTGSAIIRRETYLVFASLSALLLFK